MGSQATAPNSQLMAPRITPFHWVSLWIGGPLCRRRHAPAGALRGYSRRNPLFPVQVIRRAAPLPPQTSMRMGSSR